MADEITVESSLEAAEMDDISSAQQLLPCEQPFVATIASASSSPASNMAANDRDQGGVPVKIKPPRVNKGHSPMSTGGNYQFFYPYGFWPAHGPQMPMPPPPHVTMAAGPSWATPPTVDMNTHGSTSPTSGLDSWLVPVTWYNFPVRGGIGNR